MQKRTIDPYESAAVVAKAISGGVVLTTKADGKANMMVIGWGLIGDMWGKPTFIAYVRESRHSHKLIEQTGEFTISIPDGKLDKKIFKVAGTQTGRHVDKLAELSPTLVDPEVVQAPAMLECPITLECRVMYKQPLDKAAIPADVLGEYYPGNVTDPDETGSNAFVHVAYYGEIVASYIIEE